MNAECFFLVFRIISLLTPECFLGNETTFNKHLGHMCKASDSNDTYMSHSIFLFKVPVMNCHHDDS